MLSVEVKINGVTIIKRTAVNVGVPDDKPIQSAWRNYKDDKGNIIPKMVNSGKMATTKLSPK